MYIYVYNVYIDRCPGQTKGDTKRGSSQNETPGHGLCPTLAFLFHVTLYCRSYFIMEPQNHTGKRIMHTQTHKHTHANERTHAHTRARARTNSCTRYRHMEHIHTHARTHAHSRAHTHNCANRCLRNDGAVVQNFLKLLAVELQHNLQQV